MIQIQQDDKLTSIEEAHKNNASIKKWMDEASGMDDWDEDWYWTSVGSL